MSLNLADRLRTLQEQLRTHRTRLVEVQGIVETLQTQCAQIEGAISLCNALIAAEGEEVPVAMPTPQERVPNA
jgi:hypothetical protein